MNLLVTILIAVGSIAHWQTYTNTNFINDIAGNDSVVWLATNGGVVQLDPGPPPVGIRTFVNTDSLPANRCVCAVLDGSGNVWVGMSGGGLAVIGRDADYARPYLPNEWSPRNVRTLAWDGARLLAGTDQGLYAIETGSTFLDFSDDIITWYSVAEVPELLSDVVISISVRDRYWVGTNRGLVSVDRDFERWRPFRQPLGDSVRSVAFWQDSVLVATELGVALLAESTFRTVYRFAEPTEVFDLVVAGSSIYLATRVGLFQADAPDSSRFSVVLAEDVRAVLAGEVIWAGCGGSEQSGWGLRYAASGQGWTGYWNTCIASDVVSDCELLPSGEFYLCHDGGPITRVKADGAIEVFWSVLPVPKQVRVDSRGRPWFAHFALAGGLSMYDPNAGSWATVQWGAGSAWNIIDAFGIDRHDTKWVFNGGGVIVAVDSAGRQTVYDVSGLAPPPGGLYEFAFDNRDRVWLGLTVGLVMVDYHGTLHDRRDDRDTVIGDGLPSREVRSVAVDGQGSVWVGTPQGAAVWNGREVRTFTTVNSRLISNNVYRVRVDASDRVWMLTDAGLSVLDQVSNSWQTFTPQNSGLVLNPQGLSNFFTGLAVSDELGRALVGTLRGLSVMDYAAPGGASAERMRVYPNPCVLGRHQGLVIDSLPDDAFRVEVRTLDGRPVAELRIEKALRRAVWRPGEKASGLYLLVVTTPRGTALARAAVVRP
ncbi:hypothetical protein FJY69_08165 [candidate division WOR-3 bacterium]|nr:hypothetical protein [candidate division WOR-3 bacterium]